jgi:hypothetical protein
VLVHLEPLVAVTAACERDPIGEWYIGSRPWMGQRCNRRRTMRRFMVVIGGRKVERSRDGGMAGSTRGHAVPDRTRVVRVSAAPNAAPVTDRRVVEEAVKGGTRDENADEECGESAHRARGRGYGACPFPSPSSLRDVSCGQTRDGCPPVSRPPVVERGYYESDRQRFVRQRPRRREMCG